MHFCGSQWFILEVGDRLFGHFQSPRLLQHLSRISFSSVVILSAPSAVQMCTDFSPAVLIWQEGSSDSFIHLLLGSSNLVVLVLSGKLKPSLKLKPNTETLQRGVCFIFLSSLQSPHCCSFTYCQPVLVWIQYFLVLKTSMHSPENKDKPKNDLQTAIDNINSTILNSGHVKCVNLQLYYFVSAQSLVTEKTLKLSWGSSTSQLVFISCCWKPHNNYQCQSHSIFYCDSKEWISL